MDITRSLNVLENAIQELESALNSSDSEILRHLVAQTVRVLESVQEPMAFSHVHAALLEGRTIYFHPEISSSPQVDKLLDVVGHKIDMDHPPNGRIGIVGRAALTGITQNVGDVRDDPDYILVNESTRSQLAVAIKAHDRIWGVINIEHKALNGFDEYTKRIVEVLGAAAGIAIQNARLHQAVQDINNQSSYRNIDAILRLVLGKCLALAGAQDGAISLVSNSHIIAFNAYKEVELLKAMTAEVIRSGQAVNIGNAAELREKFALANDHSNSAVAVPIYMGSAIEGVILLESDQPEAFGPAIMQVITTLSAQAGTAIRSYRLFNRLRELHKISHELNSAPDAKNLIHRLWQQFADQQSPILQVDALSLSLLDDNEMDVEIFAVDSNHYHKDHPPQPIASERFVLIQVLEGLFIDRQEPVRVDNKDEITYLAPPLSWLNTYDSQIWAPLWIKGKIRGVLAFYNARKSAFSEDDEEFISNIVYSVADILGNMLRVERLNASVETLHEIDERILSAPSQEQMRSQPIATMVEGDAEYKELWDFIIERAKELTNADYASVFKFHSEDKLTKVSDIASPERWQEGVTYSLSDSRVVSVQVARNVVMPVAAVIEYHDDTAGDSILIRDVSALPEDERPHIYDQGTVNSILAVPMMYKDQHGQKVLVGVMNVRSRRPQAFDENDRGVLIALAGQAVLALQFAKHINNLYSMVELSRKLTGMSRKEGAQHVLRKALEILEGKSRNIKGVVSGIDIATNTLVREATEGFTPEEKLGVLDTLLIDDKTMEGRAAQVSKRQPSTGTVYIVQEHADHLDLVAPGIRSQISIAIFGKAETEQNRPEYQETRADEKPKVVKGVLTFASTNDLEFEKRDREILTYFANLIGLVWLYLNQKDRTDTLIEVAEKWSAIELDGTTDSAWNKLEIWDKVKSLIGAEHGTLPLLHRGTGRLELGQEAGCRDNAVIPEDRPKYANLTESTGIQGWVAKNDQIVNIPDVRNAGAALVDKSGVSSGVEVYTQQIGEISHNTPFGKLPTRSQLAVPIHSQNDNRVRGVLNVESPVVRAFDYEDAKLLKALAAMAWNTIEVSNRRKDERARMFDALFVSAIHDHEKLLYRVRKWFERNLKWVAPELDRRANDPMSGVTENSAYLMEIYQEFREFTEDVTAAVVERRVARKIEGTKHKPRQEFTGVYEILSKAQEMFQGEVKAGKCHFNTIDPDLKKYCIKAKRRHIDLVFKNLIRNAIEHRRTSPAEIVLEAQYIPSRSMIEFRIEDNGEGIKPENLNKIWEPGYTTRNNGLRLGAGLPTIKILIEMYNGDREVRSEPGKFTEFKIWLPAVDCGLR